MFGLRRELLEDNGVNVSVFSPKFTTTAVVIVNSNAL
jgi:hypothetical protein